MLRRFFVDNAQKILPLKLGSFRSIRSRRFIEKQCRADGRFQLSLRIAEKVNSKVCQGLFEGLILTPHIYPQHMSPKLLGTYEDELQPFLRSLLDVDLDVIVNVGCAEGYYACGCAKLWPSSVVFAFDLDPLARSVTRVHATKNNIEDRMFVHSRATPDILAKILDSRDHSLIILDCEGAELSLIDERIVSKLKNSYLLIEMHPHIVPNVQQLLQQRLSKTHWLSEVKPKRKSFSDYAALSELLGLSATEAITAIDEYRTFTPWLIAKPR